MRRQPLAVALAAALLTGSLPTWAGDAEPPTCDQRPPGFRPFIRVGDGTGFEPGIESDSQGTIYVMFPRSQIIAPSSNSVARIGSWILRSTDDGRTFHETAGLEGATDLASALEGDGAVDGKDRFYHVDTWLIENHFSRYSERGATLDMWRPFVASAPTRWTTARGSRPTETGTSTTWATRSPAG